MTHAPIHPLVNKTCKIQYRSSIELFYYLLSNLNKLVRRKLKKKNCTCNFSKFFSYNYVESKKKLSVFQAPGQFQRVHKERLKSKIQNIELEMLVSYPEDYWVCESCWRLIHSKVQRGLGVLVNSCAIGTPEQSKEQWAVLSLASPVRAQLSRVHTTEVI